MTNLFLRRAAPVAFATLAGLAAAPVLAQSADHPQGEKLKVACDLGFAPFCFKTVSGETTGFSYDLAAAVAEKLGRPGVEAVDSNFSAIFAGLFSKRFEMIAAPTTVTEERSAQMLFSEPYLPTGLGFLVKKGTELPDLAALKGKAIAVNNGSSSDKWLTAHEAEHGYAIQRYNKSADAVQAIMVGRADAMIADTPAARYIATQNPMTEVTVTVSTGGDFGFAMRPEDNEFRGQVERALECIKQDGTLAALHEKWFGIAPAVDSSTARIYPGSGTPGFAGYDEAEAPGACK